VLAVNNVAVVAVVVVAVVAVIVVAVVAVIVVAVVAVIVVAVVAVVVALLIEAVDVRHLPTDDGHEVRINDKVTASTIPTKMIKATNKRQMRRNPKFLHILNTCR
jgi:hypothetical protein